MFKTSAFALKLLHTSAYVSTYTQWKGLPTQLICIFIHVSPLKCHQLASQAISFPYAMHCQHKTMYMEKQTYKAVRE